MPSTHQTHIVLSSGPARWIGIGVLFLWAVGATALALSAARTGRDAAVGHPAGDRAALGLVSGPPSASTPGAITPSTAAGPAAAARTAGASSETLGPASASEWSPEAVEALAAILEPRLSSRISAAVDVAAASAIARELAGPVRDMVRHSAEQAVGLALEELRPYRVRLAEVGPGVEGADDMGVAAVEVSASELRRAIASIIDEAFMRDLADAVAIRVHDHLAEVMAVAASAAATPLPGTTAADAPAAPAVRTAAAATAPSGVTATAAGAPPTPTQATPGAETIATRINVNTATEAELQTLPRIGPSLARRIIDDRQRNGPFASLADLQRISGIGPATAAQLEAHVRFR